MSEETSTSEQQGEEASKSVERNSSEETPEWLSINRDRGILTKEDRKFLIGAKDLSDQAKRNARYRVRQRLINSLYDFNLIYESLGDGDLEKVIERVSNSDLEKGGLTMTNILSTLYYGTIIKNDSVEDSDEEFQSLVENSIASVERNKRDTYAKVRFEIERKNPELETLLNKIVGSNATMEEFLYYVTSAEEEEMKSLYEEIDRLESEVKVSWGPTEIPIIEFIEKVHEAVEGKNR